MSWKKERKTGQVEFIAWHPDTADEDDGRHYYDYTDNAEYVAAEFAEDYDGDNSEYPDEQDVTVKNVTTGEVKIFTVYGETVRRYSARIKEKKV